MALVRIQSPTAPSVEAEVKPANTAPTAADAAIVVTISPNSPSTSGGLTDAELRASPVPVSVTGGGDATAANQVLGNASLTSIDGKTPALVGGRVPVDGSGVTQPVSVAGSVAVTGPLTDAQLRASAVPVSLASTTITGSVAVTGPLTDAQLRASVVPVSLTSTTITGTVDTELPTAAALSDATVNPTAPMVGAAVMGWNGATWERIITAGDASDAQATTGSGHMQVIGESYLFNGTTWDRWRGAITTGGLVNPTTWLGSTAPTVGSKTSANSVPVVIASDQGAIPITGSISANSSADVLALNGDAAYTAGQLAKNLTQTPDGRLNVAVAGIVRDSPPSLYDGVASLLSLTAEGALRVATEPLRKGVIFFDAIADGVWGDMKSDMEHGGSPWEEW